MTKPALHLILFLFCLAPITTFAETPQWLWYPNQSGTIKEDEVRFLRKRFQVDRLPSRALLSISADDEAIVYLNGKKVAETSDYEEPAREDVTKWIKKGENVIAIRAKNVHSDQAGVVAVLDLTQKGQNDVVVTDPSWLAAETEQPGWETAVFNDSAWVKAASRGKLGDKPWGDVLKVPKPTSAESLTVLPGFKVELLHSAELHEGSWICMTVDNKGRLIISPQADSQPLLRLTLGRGGKVTRIEKIAAPVHQAMGLLYAHDSLYVNGHGPQGTGLYRLVDSNHNDRFDTNELSFLKKFEGEGEHGYHGVVLGPDKMIYVMNGNHTKVPADLSPASPHKNYQEELLLPRQWDANGHAVGILAPGGYVTRADREGKKWELVLAGFRNAYDFDFSAEGELFTFDSDMEWDWGLPWYRPIRVNHCVPAADFGWRSGSAVWPEYYPDSLPAALNVGIGCPTGVKFGTRSKFPGRYRNALYVLDWSYGRILAVHLRPEGASYGGEFEVLLQGKPLNLTDLEFGKDGAMYFITGGRGTQSGLYRVTPSGPPPASASLHPDAATLKTSAQARATRRMLERFYGKHDPAAVDVAWPWLGSSDRFLSYAARTVLEWQDVALWKNRALAETNVDAGLNALLGLARSSGKETQAELLGALKKFPLDSLSITQKLCKLRVIELSFIRQGRPEPELINLAIQKLDRLYPSDNEYLNRELCQLLVYLQAPDVVAKSLALLDRARTQEEQVHYAFYLRTLASGWTLEQRKHYFEWFRFAQEAAKGSVTYAEDSPYHIWSHHEKGSERHPGDLLRWFKEAGRDYSDGASYQKYLANIRKEAVDSLSPDERVALGSWIADYHALTAFKLTKPREFVQAWKMADVEPSLDEVSHGRNFAAGKAAFNDAQCILCHRFGNEGGAVGPELTAVSSKYTRKVILESILEPSKVISEQFQNYTVITKDGNAETGRIVDETPDKVVVQASLLAPERVEISKADIAERRPSKISPMPEGVANQLSKDEILDLIAYLESGGKEQAANFQAASQSR